MKLFVEAFDLNADGRISFEEFKGVLCKLRERCKSEAGKACEYKSYNKLMEDRFKHKRIQHEVPDKYKAPITFNQSVGFHSRELEQMGIEVVTTHRIKQCNETKYAAEMVRTGFI